MLQLLDQPPPVLHCWRSLGWQDFQQTYKIIYRLETHRKSKDVLH